MRRIFSIHVKAGGQTYIHATSVTEAVKKLSQLRSTVFNLNDVDFSYFKDGDPTAPEISLGNRIWAEGPMVGEEFKMVSRNTMADTMSGVGKTVDLHDAGRGIRLARRQRSHRLRCPWNNFASPFQIRH